LEEAVDHICCAIALGDLAVANQTLHGPSFHSREERQAVRDLVNKMLLFPQQREWNVHGTPRTFRFWSQSEKASYIVEALSVAHALEDLTPHVTMGFGAVLGHLRNGDLIPHDDDVDVIVALDRSDWPSISIGRQKVRDVLQKAGFVCKGEFPSHWNVAVPSGKHVDVFIGLIEGDRVSWFPSSRRNLRLDEVFPPTLEAFLGVKCVFPRDIERYVEVTYGADWRHPIDGWDHPWDKAQFSDIL
jgi:hypothetical protein